MLTIADHPLLDLDAFVTAFAEPLGALPSPAPVLSLLAAAAPAPLRRDEEVREAVRKLLRHGGFKPSGRSKPASEYLVRAVSEGQLASINRAVDIGNVVSLHSGLPISVVDFDRVSGPMRVEVAAAGAKFVFNSAGHEIDVSGLVGLSDRLGPCANPVKDAMRTKTTAETRRTLSLIWGTAAFRQNTGNGRLVPRAAARAQWDDRRDIAGRGKAGEPVPWICNSSSRLWRRLCKHRLGSMC
jgi:hypothetical protein